MFVISPEWNRLVSFPLLVEALSFGFYYFGCSERFKTSNMLAHLLLGSFMMM